MGDAHDRGDDLHRRRQLLERLRLVGRPPDVGVRRVGLLGGIAVGESVGLQEGAHLRPPAELGDEVGVEPRLVDPQRRVDEQAVAIEALDVVALVGAAVAPDVDAVVVHRLDQQRAGDGPSERRRVEVRLAGRGDVEGTALQGHQALAHELGPAVDEAGVLGAVLRRPVGHAAEVGLVVLPEVGRVGVGDRPLGAHPGDRGRRVEPAGEGDADALADRQRQQDPARAHPANVLRRCERLSASEGAASNCAGSMRRGRGTQFTVRPVAAGEAGDGEERAGGGDRQLDHAEPRDLGDVERGDDGEHAGSPEAGPRQPPRVVDGEEHHHERRDERQHRHEQRLRVAERAEPPRVQPELCARLPHRRVGDDDERPPQPGDEPPPVGELAGAGHHRRGAAALRQEPAPGAAGEGVPRAPPGSSPVPPGRA